jgi:hypothetical protein
VSADFIFKKCMLAFSPLGVIIMSSGEILKLIRTGEA